MGPLLRVSACALMIFGCAQIEESKQENDLWADPAGFALSSATFVVNEEFLTFAGERLGVPGLGSRSVLYVGPAEVALAQLTLQSVITPGLISSKEKKLQRAADVILESFGPSIKDIPLREIYTSLIAKSESNAPTYQVLLEGSAEISQGADTVVLNTRAAIRDTRGDHTLRKIHIAAIGKLDAQVLDLSAETKRVTLTNNFSELGQLTGTVLMDFYASIRKKCGQQTVNKYRRGEREQVLLARKCESIEHWAVFYSDHQGFTVFPSSWLQI